MSCLECSVPELFSVCAQNSNNPTHRRIYERMHKAQSYSLNAVEGFHKAQKGNYAFIGESVSLDLAVAKYCNLTRAPEIIGMRGYSIAAPLGTQPQSSSHKQHTKPPHQTSPSVCVYVFRFCSDKESECWYSQSQ